MNVSRDSIIDPSSNLTPKQQVAAMREAKKREKTEGLTFKPALVSNSAKYSTEESVSSNRFERLYVDAKSRQDKAEVATIRTSRELSFKPKITPRAQSRERSDNARYSETGAGRISTDKISNVMKPSFTPEITRRASSIDRSHSQQSVGERMHSVAQTFATRHAKRKEDLAAKEATLNTFNPKLNISNPANKRSASTDRRSGSATRLSVTPAEVSQRQKVYEMERAKKREELLKSKEERETKELKFKPKIIKSALAPAPIDGSTVFERLQKTAVRDNSELLEQLDSELTFRPKIAHYRGLDPGSGQIEGDSETDEDKAARNVHSKLYEEAQLRQRQRQDEIERAQQAAFAELTFRPSIPSAASSLLTAANMQAHTEKNDLSSPTAHEGSQTGTNRTASTVFDRLSTGHKSKTADMLLQIKTSIELQECTFKPTVPHGLASSSVNSETQESIFARLQKDAAGHQKKLDRLDEEKRANELKQVTNGPHIPESSREIAKQRKSLVTAPSSSSPKPVSPKQRALPKPHDKRSPSPQYPPSIPAVSHNLSASTNSSIFDRLQKDAIEHQKRLDKLEEERLANEVKHLRKGPIIPESSKDIASLKKRKSAPPTSSASHEATKNGAVEAAMSSTYEARPEAPCAPVECSSEQDEAGEIVLAPVISGNEEIMNACEVSAVSDDVDVNGPTSSGVPATISREDYETSSVPEQQQQVTLGAIATPAATGLSKVEELRARLAKQKADREKLKVLPQTQLQTPVQSEPTAEEEETF